MHTTLANLNSPVLYHTLGYAFIVITQNRGQMHIQSLYSHMEKALLQIFSVICYNI